MISGVSDGGRERWCVAARHECQQSGYGELSSDWADDAVVERRTRRSGRSEKGVIYRRASGERPTRSFDTIYVED